MSVVPRIGSGMVAGVLVLGSATGYQLANKGLEFLVLYVALLVLCLHIMHHLRLPKWGGCLASMLYGGGLFLTSFVLIWGLNDYFTTARLLNDEHPTYQLYGKTTGNFSDVQVLVEVREEFGSGWCYYVHRSELIQGYTFRNITSTVAGSDHFELGFDRDEFIQVNFVED